MNAYELLEIKELEKEDGQEIGILVKSRTRNNIVYLIQRLNKMLQMDFDVSEKLVFVNEILEQLTYYITAGECIETQEKRKEYIAQGMPDVETIADENRRQLFDANIFIPTGDSQLTNAYQMLKIRNETISLDNENAIEDGYVTNKTLSLIKLSLSSSQLDKMEDIEKMITQLLRYMWAYSKISTREKRLAYTYKIYAKKGKTMCKDKIPTKEESDQLSEITEITNLDINNDGYDVIEVCKTGNTLNYKGVTPDDDVSVGEYLITKHRTDGRKVTYPIYSSIDVSRLSSDEKYASEVAKTLTDEKIALGNRFLGGYIGEIVDGQLRFSVQKMGACIQSKSQERKKERMEEEKKQNAANIPITSDPDQDDDFDL